MLACLIVPGPPLVSVFLHAGSLLASSVSPGLTPAQRFCVAIVIDLAAVLWILPQRHALSGGAFARYAASLPVPRGARLGVEATLLAAANGAILISAGTALARMLSPLHDPYAACCLLVLLGLAMIAQHAVLTRRLIVLAGVVLGNGALVAGLAAPDGVRWVLPIAAITAGVMNMLAAERFGRGGGSGRLGPGWRSVEVPVRILARRAPILLIQCKAVAEHPTQTVLRFGAAIVLAFGADRLMAIFHFDARALPTAILAMAASSLLLAGFYRMLAEARSVMASYLAALPLPRHYWPECDTKFVLLLNGVPLVILLSPQLMRGLLSLLIIFILALAYQVLLALLRWPVIHGGRRSLLYAVLLSALWSGAAIAAVSR
ncbi:MAG TPA: hypothetical protein VGG99_27200 [Acetobacteraceae bacterium]